MRKICDLPYGYELIVDPADCSPMLRRGRHFMCRPHERTDPTELRHICVALMSHEVRARRRGDNLAVAAIVNTRCVMDEQLKSVMQQESRDKRWAA